MKSDLNSQSLTYGSIISISHVQDDNSFVTCDGFIKNAVMLRNFKSFTKSKNFANNLFQIYPKFNNTTKNDILRDLKPNEDQEEVQLSPEEVLDALMNDSEDVVQVEDITLITQDKIVSKQSNLLKEFKYNLDTFEKVKINQKLLQYQTKQLKITYKQTIQLLHLASSKFLACFQKESRFESQNYNMNLVDFPSEATLFKILPAYKFQREGEQIIYASDIVYLVRSIQFNNKETYVHASGEMGQFGRTTQKITKIDQQVLKRPSLKNPTLIIRDDDIKKREVNASVEDKTQWKITIFSEYIPEYQTYLKCGDVIWLHHSETNTTIAAARKGKAIDKNSFSDFNLMEWMSDVNLELKIVKGDTKENYEEYIGDTYSMWIIEYEDQKIGGRVYYDKNYRFKHLSSGLYLAGKVRRAKEVSEPNKNQFYLSQSTTPETLFHFMPLKNTEENDKTISKGSYVYICNSANYWMDIVIQEEYQAPTNTDAKLNFRQDSKGTMRSQVSVDKNIADLYIPILHQDLPLRDESVFKLYSSTSNDVWEITFVLSCIKSLVNYLSDSKTNKNKNKDMNVTKNLVKDFGMTKDLVKDFSVKIKQTKQCIKDLNYFCYNKLYNSTPEQKFGTINPFRQKLLREQYYIDILVKILAESMTQQDFSLWEMRSEIYDRDQASQSQKSQDIPNPMKDDSIIQTNVKTNEVGEIELLQFVALKVDLTIEVFELITSICKDNFENELYTFNLIPNILEQVKYIPQSITCLISILQNNGILLAKLSENLQVEQSYSSSDKLDQIMMDPDELSKKTQTRQPTSSYPNILVYFINLLESVENTHKAQFLRFLRSVCKYGDNGINCNQENLYKLYKKLNDRLQIMGVSTENQICNDRLQYGNKQLILPSKCNDDTKEMSFIVEQLLFFSDVSFGRNYLWRKELENQFELEFLFDNIWNKNPQNPKYELLKPSFCKLAMSLYVDHDPLNRRKLPHFCRVYKKIDSPDSIASKLREDPPEINYYQRLISNLFGYLDGVKSGIKMNMRCALQQIKRDEQIAKDKQNKGATEHNDDGGEKIKKLQTTEQGDLNILNSELLINSSEMLSLILSLDVFEVIYKDDPQKFYMNIVEITMNMLTYDRRYKNYLAVIYEKQEEEVKRKLAAKKQKKELVPSLGAINPFAFAAKMAKNAAMLAANMAANIVSDAKEEDDDDDDDEEEGAQVDDIHLYTNPLMRGFIKFYNLLENVKEDDSGMALTEVQLKLKLCDMIDHFLDMRQDFLLSNFLFFFKHFIVFGESPERKEEQKQIEEWEDQGLSEVEITQLKNQKICQSAIKINLLGLLPNVPKTGLLDIDEPKKEEVDPFAALQQMGNMMSQEEKSEEFFINYFSKKNRNDAAREIFDLDSSYSAALGDVDMGDGDPVACLLPQLLSCVYFVHDENLERRCVSTLMRIYNQREELYRNIQSIQLIFDPQTALLYDLLKVQQRKLSQLVDRSEIWLTEFTKYPERLNPELDQTLDIIKNIRWGFFRQTQVQNGVIKLLAAENHLTIDQERQAIMNSLNVQEPVINLVKDQMQHFVGCIQNRSCPVDQKIKISSLFISAFQFLKYFCKEHFENQMILYEYIPMFMSKLQFNLGQITLISEIFKDNSRLLDGKVDAYFLQGFTELIQTHGRQSQFLEPLMAILPYRDKYIFDNQLRVLNLFLQQNGNINHNLLFAREEKENFQFDFSGHVSPLENDFLTDLQDGFSAERDSPYLYHRKLLELLLSTTLIQAGSELYNPSQNEMQQRENFTISVAKLRKIIKPNYLLSMLIMEDNLSGDGKLMESKGRIMNMLKKGHVQTNTKVAVQSETEIEENKSKSGISLLKKQLSKFFRLVHITSEKVIQPNPEMQADFLKLIKFETQRLGRIENNHTNHINYNRFTDYLIEGIIPLFISYFERIIAPVILLQVKTQYEEDNDGDENQEYKALNNYAKQLSLIIGTFFYLNILKKRQVLILKKFFEQYPPTPFSFIFTYQDEFQQAEQSKNLQQDQQNQYPIEIRSHLMNVIATSEIEVLPHLNLFQNPQVQKQKSELKLIDEKQEIKIEMTSKVVQNSERKNKVRQSIQPSVQQKVDEIYMDEEKEILASNNQKDEKIKIFSNQVSQNSPDRVPLNNQFEDNNQNKNQALPKQVNAKMTMFSMMNKKMKKHLDIEIISENITDEEAIVIENFWKDFRGEFTSMKSVEEEILREKDVLAMALMQIDKYIPSEKQKSVETKIDYKLIVKKLLNFLQQAINNPKNKDTIITLIQVIRQSIEQIEDQKLKVEQQDLLNKLGATRMVLLVLSESSSLLDSEIYINFLMFLNTLLDEGNLRVQKNIYDFFISNQKSEVIFQRFNSVILKQIESISVKSKEKKKAAQRKLNQLEIEEPTKQESTNQEIIQAKEDERVVNQVLKFLQNCVEGHYLELQNYIRQQSNSRNSYNMINQVADLLRAYYYEDRSQQMYDNMIRCLDTLNELVQGPCPENQIAVAESKFFEIANDLFSQKKEKDKSNESQSQSQMKSGSKSQTVSKSKTQSVGSKKASLTDDLTDWMMARLQLKCLILILSLIEQRELNESNVIVKRIARNLPMNLLQKLMAKCYKKYLLIYGQQYISEAFDHFLVDPREMDPKELADLPDGYFETIIQIGFYIFFLMRYYMECDPHMDNQFVQMYRGFRRRQLKQRTGGIEDLIFGDNIIGQLVSLAMGIIQQAMILAMTVKQAGQQALTKNGTLTPEQLEEIEQEKLAMKKFILKTSFEFFITNSATIEVVRNEKLELVFFFLLPHTKNMPKEKKIEFHELVDRGSTKSKIQGLLDESERLIEICVHEEKLKRFFSKQKFLAIFANYVKLWKDLAFLFTLLLNLFILGSFSDGYGDRMNNYHLFQSPDYTNEQTKFIFLICGVIMTCCSIFVVLFFLCKNLPLILQKAWNEKTPFEGPDQMWFMWFIVILVKLLTVVVFILKEIEVVYYLAYGALAVFGTIIHPFFFAFHLTEILIRYPTLKNVIKSVWEPRTQLFLTLVLFIILVYVYALLGYTFFSQDFDGKCDATIFCFLYTFDWTFKANGGVGGYLTGNNVSKDEEYQPKYEWKRFAYDNTSNIILVIIMVNIVAGIIIDTFGSLRENENNKNRDIEDKCFMCGNLKTTFDRLSDSTTGGGFNHHIKIISNHYMWNYVFFIAFLMDKDSTEYTGIEQFIWDKIQNKDLNWFPFNKARELALLEESQVEETSRVTKIQQEMTSVVEIVDKANKALTQLRQSRLKMVVE